MNLDELQSIRNRERNTDSLQQLQETFYEDVGRYIADLKAERERVAEQADDPWSDPDINRLSDEIDTAEEISEAVYERRMGKLVKEASLAAAGYATDAEGLTLEEERLFEDLVTRIERNKDSVLEVLSGDSIGAGSTASVSGGEDTDSTDSPTPEESPKPPTDAPVKDQSGDPGTDPAGPSTVEPEQPEPIEADGSGVTALDDGIDAASLMDPNADEGSVEDRTATGTDTPASQPSPQADDEVAADPLVADGASQESTQPPGETPEPTAPSPDSTATESPAAPSSAEPEATTEPSSAGAAEKTSTTDRTTVRITSDIGEILGVDEHEYHLAADDVVTLPEENATPLIERDAAERVE